MIDELGQLPVDAVVMLGTGMPTLAPLLQANRAGRGAAVLSCMQALAWKATGAVARLSGLRPPELHFAGG